MAEVIKSRARVKALGEVFTQPREVIAMLDLIPIDQYRNPLSTWMEPACGTGNFLIEIIKRKLSHTTGDKHTYALKCLSSLYGIDISPENVLESRDRLYRYLLLTVQCDDLTDFLKQATAILKANIQVGNSLKPKDITIMEYHWKKDSFTRSSHRMSDL